MNLFSKIKFFLPALSALTLLWIYFSFNSITYATIAPFQAKDFCKNGATNCIKEDKSGRSGSISCPNGKIVTNVYVHAGDGQTVYQLPHDGFNVSYSNGGQTTTVTVTTHQHDLSWLGVTCGNEPTSTPTPTSIPTPTSTPTIEPSATPTPTPEDKDCEDKNVSTCIIVECDGEETCEVEVGNTPTPTLTSTPAPTATPTSAQENKEENKSNDNPPSGSVGGSSSSNQGEVLGITTFAPTGVFTEALSNGMLTTGTLLTLASTALYAKKKK
jgi:hypothetical protein